jgi:WD40 repeat protein
LTLILFLCIPAQGQDLDNDDIIVHLEIDCVCKAEWNFDGSKLAIADWSDLQIWDTTSWELERVIPDAYAGYSFQWHPYKNMIATVRGGRQEGVIIWDANTGDIVREFSRPAPSDVGGVLILHTLAWSPDGAKIATDSDAIDTIIVWDVESSGQTPELVIPVNYPEEPYHNSLELEWSGDLLLSGGIDYAVLEDGNLWNGGALRLWNANTGALVRSYKGHYPIDWGLNGDQFASGEAGNKITIWDVDSGDKLATFDELPKPILAFSWNLEENLIVASDNDDNVRIWDVDAGRGYAIENLPIIHIRSLAWRPNSMEFAVAGGGGVVILQFDK